MSRNTHITARRRVGRAVSVLLVSSALASSQVPAATIPGGDYGGADLMPQDGDVLAGTFTNVGSFVVPAAATVWVEPGTPLFVEADSIRVDGVLDGSGAGFAGGANGSDGSPGNGPGGGEGGLFGPCVHASGGGGGGYGGNGGDGGQSLSSPPAAKGGPAYGIPSPPGVAMGSGGGGAGDHGCGYNGTGGRGGAGGGAVALHSTDLRVEGSILVDGEPADPGIADTTEGWSASSGGGGAGGGIELSGVLRLKGVLSARGGDGASFAPGSRGTGWGQGGGGGAGGRIKLDGAAELAGAFSTDVAGGGAGSSHTQTTAPAMPGQGGSFFDASTHFVCGDEVLDTVEECDEGSLNGTPESCCSADCTFAAPGSACDDGDACTLNDTCNAGTCEAGGATLLMPLEDVGQTLQCVEKTLGEIGG